MPIYAYKCDACGFAKDVLQKMSEDTLTDCPSCGKAEFKKQVTAAGFQLKGSGWYVTDFRGDTGAPAASGSDNAAGPDAVASSASTPAAAPLTPSTPAAASPPSSPSSNVPPAAA
jgi:putative FmdB family regulatory protein